MTSNCTQRHRAVLLVVPLSLLAISGAASADPDNSRPAGVNSGGLASGKTGEEHRVRHRNCDAGACWPDDLSDTEEIALDERLTIDGIVVGGAGPLRGREPYGT